MKNTLSKIQAQLKCILILLFILNTVLIFGLFKRSSVGLQAGYKISTRNVNIESIGGVPIYGGAIPVKVMK